MTIDTNRTSYKPSFSAIKLCNSCPRPLLKEILNNVEVLKLTQKLQDVGEDLFVNQIPENLCLQTYKKIPARIKFLVSQGKGYFKTIEDVTVDKLKEISANKIFDKFLGIYDDSNKYLSTTEMLDEFNKLLK